MKHMQMKRLILALTALITAGCGTERSDTPEADKDATASHSTDRSDGTITARIETGEGAATVRTGPDVPVDLPRGFSIYPGADVTSNSVFGEGAESGALVTMEAAASGDEMIAFYRKQAKTAGIDIELDMDTDKMSMIGGKAADGSPFSFTVRKGGEGKTVGQLMVGGPAGI